MLIVPPSRHAVVELVRNERGVASGARAFARVSAPVSVVQTTFDRIEREGAFAHFVAHIPLVRELRRDGDRFFIELQFKVSLLSVRFGARLRLVRESATSVRFDYIDGEPKQLTLRFAVVEAEPGLTVLQTVVGYDIDSLGWLTKYFLRHHPEIRDGAHAGTGLTMVEALRQAIEQPAEPHRVRRNT